MKQIACALIVVATVVNAIPTWAAPQRAVPEEMVSHPAQAAGMSLLAAVTNVVYFPVRLGVTICTAGVGGLTGWLTGGNYGAARSVWSSTDGQPYITPAVLEGRERLRFGPDSQ